MARRFQQMYPDLFVGLTEAQVHSINNALAASWHEGWTPNREDVADLIDMSRANLSGQGVVERAIARVAAQRASKAV